MNAPWLSKCSQKYPVTYVQYRAFVEAPDGYRNPAWWQGLIEQIPNPGRRFNRYGNLERVR